MAARRILIWLIGCMLISCTKEVITIIDEPKKEEVNASISVQLTFNSDVSTRSSWAYDDYFPSGYPTEQERKVNNILIVIFKDIFLEQFDLYREGDFYQNPIDGSIELSKTPDDEDELDLEPGQHYFYVIMNIPEDLYEEIQPKLTNGIFSLKKEDFEKQIMEIDLEFLKGESSTGNGLVMTNRNPPELKMIYTEDQCKDLQVDNNIIIPVGRACAKVSLAYIPAKTGELHGSLSDITYKVVNHPSRMYIMPVIENNILMTPHYSTTNLATDYFIRPAKDILEDTSEWLTVTTRKTMETKNKEELDFDYCIENNVKTHLKSNSTGLVIRGTFTPEEWITPEGLKGDPTDDGTFWRIALYDRKTNVLVTYTKGYYNAAPTDTVSKLGDEYRIHEYPQGLCYYPFWLKTDAQHQVKRNDFHKVVITHLHGAGYPGNEFVNPDIDPDEEQTWGWMEVFVYSWDEYYSVEVIGDNTVEDPSGNLNPDIKDWDDQDQDETLEGGNGNNIFN